MYVEHLVYYWGSTLFQQLLLLLLLLILLIETHVFLDVLEDQHHL